MSETCQTILMVLAVCGLSPFFKISPHTTACNLLILFLYSAPCKLLSPGDHQTMTCNPSISAGSAPHSGATCSFSCDQGYGIKIGLRSLTCEKNGSWSGSVPACSKCGWTWNNLLADFLVLNHKHNKCFSNDKTSKLAGLFSAVSFQC